MKAVGPVIIGMDVEDVGLARRGIGGLGHERNIRGQKQSKQVWTPHDHSGITDCGRALPIFRKSILTSFFPGAPGVLRPPATIRSNCFVRRFTTSGCAA